MFRFMIQFIIVALFKRHSYNCTFATIIDKLILFAFYKSQLPRNIQEITKIDFRLYVTSLSDAEAAHWRSHVRELRLLDRTLQ